MGSIKPIIEKLEGLFQKFNEEFYNGELQKPIIVASQDITGGAYGYITTWKAWQNTDSEDTGYYEINICAEHLTRPFEEICSTLLHEMAHLYCLQNGIKDTSRGSSYHNKKFKVVGEAHGLTIEQDEKYGWTITSLNAESKAVVDSLDEVGFTIHRTKMVIPEKEKAKKKSSSRKYVCPDCGIIVRATKEVRIICSDCDVELELEEN